jgi:hypothetical protein
MAPPFVPISLHPSHKVVLSQLQKWFPNEFASNVEDCSCQLRPIHRSLDLFKGIGNTLAISNICTYTNCLPTSCLDFFDDRLVVGRIAGQKGDWVF